MVLVGPPLGHRTAAAPGEQRQAARSIPIRIESSNAITRAGVHALLADHPRLRVLAPDEGVRAAVLVRIEEHLTTVDLQLIKESRDGACGDAPSAVLAVTDDLLADDDLLAALDAGVCGLLRRSDAGRTQLVAAILALADGAVLLPPRLQGLLVRQLRRVRTEVLDPNGLTLSGLTARERDVLRLVAEGLDTDEIAARLAFSPRTVKYVLTHVMTRYRLRSRTHAVAYAVRHGAI